MNKKKPFRIIINCFLTLKIKILELVLAINKNINTNFQNTIKFKNKAIENEVREKIHKPTGPISYSDIKHIAQLDLDNCELNDISELKYFNGLLSLHLDNNRISDISPLKNLNKLIVLILSHNKQLSDISPLKNLTNLDVLDLSYNNQSYDLKILNKLTNLRGLFLNYNQINDICPLKNLVYLIELRLTGNKKITNINNLKYLANLESLHLGQNLIHDVTSLKNLNKLVKLDLSNNQINDLTPLKSLTNLTILALFNNQISNITGLINLVKLEYLYLNNNKVNDINALQNLSKLKKLHLNGNPIVSIPSFKMDKNLHLYIYGNEDRAKILQTNIKISNILNCIINHNMNELDKEKAIHDYIINNSKYYNEDDLKNTVEDDLDNEYGVLIKCAGISSGYAKTANTLLKMAGIESILVAGKAKWLNRWYRHTWNIVKIDGEYYNLDTALDNAGENSNYNYFNISDTQMEIDHKWNKNIIELCKPKY